MRKVQMEIPQTFIPATHLSQKPQKKRRKQQQNATQKEKFQDSLKTHKKTKKKGQGSELNRVTEE